MMIKMPKKFKIILPIIIIIILSLGVYLYHLRITKPFRIAGKFLTFINNDQYEDALKMCNKANSSPLLDKDGKISGIHFIYEGYNHDCYFNDIKNKEVSYPEGLYWYIRTNFIGEPDALEGVVVLDDGHCFIIKGETVEFINQKE